MPLKSSLIKGICNKSLYTVNGTAIQLGDILIERRERTVINNQYEVLSSTVKGIFSQREYFSKDIASENNVGYKIIRLHDVVLSPQNLWMGNVNYNDNFEVGIVSPSYKVFSIAENLDKRYIATLLKTHRALYNYMLVSEQGASIVRRNLNMEAFEQITFKIPPLSKQEKIGNAISILQARITSAIRIKTAYEAQKQWLLTQMFI
ncbi:MULTISPECIES: restriction endonuclease subunit S [Bacteroides]|uniref:restriction endonuclease subunit S n=1 Tax=Bacteroides TaxID=816 RepID=UPI001E565D3D|nr:MULTISPECIES: restriction endonuclease subunit S [Bacteroides]MDC2588991.1 restriction endonuclease subunit S [Bacteroides ovatus]